jgi:diguanylate cyclase (GGDEF)-like protein
MTRIAQFFFGTLVRQLGSGVSLIFLVALAGVGTIYVANARAYLQEQLESHAQDAATSLGLSVGFGLAQGRDATLPETAINAMFDRGYYDRIALVGTNGVVQIERRLGNEATDVPEFFTRLFPLRAPTASSLVSSGWKQLGRIVVTSNSRLAYRQLWRTSTETLGWLVAIFVLSQFAMTLFLGGILRPLGMIAATADAIGRRDFREIPIQPKARELRQVVAAMNDLSGKVRSAIEYETGRAERLQQEAFLDPLTGLWNRAGFGRQFSARLSGDDEADSGAVLLVELDDLAGINRTRGHEAADQTLKRVGEVLTRHAAAGAAACCARLSGGGFAVLLVNTSREDTERHASRLCRDLSAELEISDQAEAHAFHCGGAVFRSGNPAIGAMLAAADVALARARATGSAYEIQTLESTSDASGSLDWRRLITEALEAGRTRLFSQEVRALGSTLDLPSELTARLATDDGRMIPAALFLPMAVRHRLAARLDGQVIRSALEALRIGRFGNASVSVNVSSESVRDASFLESIRSLLAADTGLAARITFEVGESTISLAPEEVQRFSGLVRSMHSHFAIDNFGIQRDFLTTLSALMPDYVKLAAAHTGNIEANSSAQAFLGAVIRSCESLGVPVIAQSVEDEKQVPVLKTLGFSGIQGYAVAHPVMVQP